MTTEFRKSPRIFAVLYDYLAVNLQRGQTDHAVNVCGGDIVTAEVVITSDGDMNRAEDFFIRDDVALQARRGATGAD